MMKELKSLIAAFHDQGVKLISDIVINHRKAERLDNNGLSIFEGGTPDNRLDWDVSYICSTDVQFKGTRKPDTGSDGKPLANQDKHRETLVNWVNDAGGVVTAFDFTTKMILGAAVEGELWKLKDANGKPPGMIGIIPSNAVTFVDNHDTGSQSYGHFQMIKLCRVMFTFLLILATPQFIMFTLLFSLEVSSQLLSPPNFQCLFNFTRWID
ncbi:alpha-amylase 3, chloroplastic [Trifolium repens]|nr:alpha-amylase 3, chloroplastic [Trifolium repens]